jgi:hypothetical protein
MPKLPELTERDSLALVLCFKFRVLTEEQIQVLCNFSTIKTTSRRMRILEKRGYVKREKVLPNIPMCYTATQKTAEYLGLHMKPYKIALATILHEIAIVDIAIYILLRRKIEISQVMTDKEQFYYAFYNNKEIQQIPKKNKHRPDLLILDEKVLIEYERTLKTKSRYLKNAIENCASYKGYKHFWIIEESIKTMKKPLEQELEKRGIEYSVVFMSDIRKYISRTKNEIKITLDDDYGSALNNYELQLSEMLEQGVIE